MESGWCKEEFLLAHLETIEGRKDFIIFLMVDNLGLEDLPDEMHKFIRTRTYIEVYDKELFRKQLLRAMPKTPLQKIQVGVTQANNVPALYNRFYTYNNVNK